MVEVGSLEYTFYLSDYMSAGMANIQQGMMGLQTQMVKTTQTSDSQTISFMGQLMAVMALYSGMRRLTMSLHTLGIISDADNAKMMKLAAAVGLVVAVFQMFKGIVLLVNQLKKAEIGLAIVETYRAILHNPAKLGLAMAGVAVGGLIGGILIGRSGGGGETTVTQTVNFGGYGPTQGSRETARNTLEFAGG